MKAQHLQQGEHAEAACCAHLKKHGLRLLCRNYRCRFGEIDIVMRQQDTLVFVEVRYRSDSRFGSGLDSITRSKQEKLRRTAEHYMQRHGYSCARFDVVAVSRNNHTGYKLFNRADYAFDWVKDAF